MSNPNTNPITATWTKRLDQDQVSLDFSRKLTTTIADAIDDGGDVLLWELRFAYKWGALICATPELTALSWRKQAKAVVALRRKLALLPSDTTPDRVRFFGVFHRRASEHALPGDVLPGVDYLASMPSQNTKVELILRLSATSLPPTCRLVEKERVVPAEYRPEHIVTDVVMECDEREESD